MENRDFLTANAQEIINYSMNFSNATAIKKPINRLIQNYPVLICFLFLKNKK